VWISEFDAWALRRILTGIETNGELAGLSSPWQRIGDHLTTIELRERKAAFDGFLCGQSDPDELTRALADVDPGGPPPVVGSVPNVATLADVRRIMAEAKQPWPGWLASGVLNGLAADPGTGKTILAADLARRLWLRLTWPDGQCNPFPEHTRTLWVAGDRHFPQLIDLAASYGLPAEAILLNAAPSNPTGGLDLDDSSELGSLADRIRATSPGLVIIDTVGMTTARNLCRPEESRAYFAPLMEMAQATEAPFLCVTHLSKDGDALGRRIVGAVRVLWKMSDPDREGQPNRRRLWVDKTYTEKPLALGMTIGNAGCDFDFSPPTAPAPGKGGRPADAREAAERFIRESLTEHNDRKATVLCDAWVSLGKGHGPSAFWRARDSLVESGALICEGKPLVMHLNSTSPETPSPEGAF
jgi:hypothetical protein